MEHSGILILHKPQGITSHDAVYRIRRLYGTRRVGHTGTLDPVAEGVLVMLIGRAAKAAEYLSSDRKGYTATLRLGLTTDTEDVTGTVLTQSETLPSPDEVIRAVASFAGTQRQIPPMYSALKIGGKKLCDLAREGKTVEREAREITVHSIICTPLNERDYRLEVSCSAGTYIRTLCADIGASLGCGAVMATLLRTEAGGFSLDQALTLEALEAMSEEERRAQLIPTEALFDSLPLLSLPSFYERLAKNGCEIYQSKLRTHYSCGQRLRIGDAGGHFFALGEVRDYEAGSAVKLLKRFDGEES